MALVFQDGFETWGTDATARTNMVNSSNGWLATGSLAITTGNARTGTLAGKVASGNNIIGPRLSLGGAKTSASGYFGVGFAAQIGALPTTVNDIAYFKNTNANVEWGIAITPSGAVALYRGGSSQTQLAVTAAGVVTPNVYVHFEIKCLMPTTVSATNGELYLRINGLPALTVTGTDIYITATLYGMESITLNPLEQAWNATSAWYDDVYVWDSTGSYCNDWVGNKGVYTYYPDADTATAEWSITGVTQGFDAINDSTPDADTTYISATAVTQTSNFEIPTVLSTLTGIKAVTLQTSMRQDSAGVSEVQASLLSGVTYATGTSRVAPYPGATSSTYTAYQDHFYQDPGGAGDLTPTLISAMQVRLKRTV